MEAFSIEPILSDISQLREQYTTLQSFLDSLVCRMLSDGVLGSWLSSDEAESRIDKIIQQYREQQDRRQDDETEVLFELTQEDEENDQEFDDEDDRRRR